MSPTILLILKDDLLCARASPCQLPLLSSGFRIHLSSHNKLNASDGSFNLSGYISGHLFNLSRKSKVEICWLVRLLVLILEILLDKNWASSSGDTAMEVENKRQLTSGFP